jgi:hypothetical protein
VLTFDDFAFDSLLLPLLVAGGCMLLLRCVAALCARVTAQRDSALIALSARTDAPPRSAQK